MYVISRISRCGIILRRIEDHSLSLQDRPLAASKFLGSSVLCCWSIDSWGNGLFNVRVFSTTVPELLVDLCFLLRMSELCPDLSSVGESRWGGPIFIDSLNNDWDGGIEWVWRLVCSTINQGCFGLLQNRSGGRERVIVEVHLIDCALGTLSLTWAGICL